MDVFADRPFAGNPLAVVHGADGLGTAQLQALAREFNLSETVFPLPPTQSAAPSGMSSGMSSGARVSGPSGADYRARIFTPASELPFAGHPSVGVAWVLGREGVIGLGDAVQECGAGLLPVTVSASGARVYGGAPTLGPVFDAEALAAAVGLAADDVEPGSAGSGGAGSGGVGLGGVGLGGAGLGGAVSGGAVSGGAGLGGAGVPAAQVAGAGLEWTFLRVRPDAVAHAVLPASADLAGRCGGTGLVVVAFDPDARTAHVRAFAPAQGVPEDPATGSAAVALGVWLVSLGLLPADGESEVRIAQGAEMGRPSHLDLRVEGAGAKVRTSVGGNVVPVSSGTIAVPPLRDPLS